MKSIRFRLLVAALAVMLGGALAHSQSTDATAAPPPHRHGFGMGHEIGFYVRALGVTDDQKAQMKAVLQKERPTMKPLMQQMHELQTQLKPYEEGTFDATKVQTLVAAQAQTLVQLKVNEARIHSELYALLTSDQQAKLKELQAARAAKMQQHMQSESQPAPEQ